MKYVLILMLLSSNAWAGGMVGNGGDSVLQEFNLRGIQLANYFDTETLIAKAVGIDSKKFREVVNSTQLSVEDRLILRGIEVDAINYPDEKRIEVSRARWRENANRNDVYFVQRRIVLHEYLWVYGINDQDYKVSNLVIEQLERTAWQQSDKTVQKLLLGGLCDTLKPAYEYGRVDYSQAEKFLSWGLNLNQDCEWRYPNPQGRGELTGMTRPFSMLLVVSPNQPKALEDKVARLHLAESMLRYGSDPNFVGLLNYTASHEIDIFRLLIKYGANPMLTIGEPPNESTVLLKLVDPRNQTLTPEIFKILSDAGVDFNEPAGFYGISAVTSLVSSPGRSEIFELLVDTQRVNWCAIHPFKKSPQKRVYDLVHPTYLPILANHGIKCGAAFLGPLWESSPRSCEVATQQALIKCNEKGFNFVHLLYNKSGKLDCDVRPPEREGYSLMYDGAYYCSEDA